MCPCPTPAQVEPVLSRNLAHTHTPAPWTGLREGCGDPSATPTLQDRLDTGWHWLFLIKRDQCRVREPTCGLLGQGSRPGGTSQPGTPKAAWLPEPPPPSTCAGATEGPSPGAPVSSLAASGAPGLICQSLRSAPDSRTVLWAAQVREGSGGHGGLCPVPPPMQFCVSLHLL